MPFPFTFPFFFDPWETALVDAQKGPSYKPYASLILTKAGETTYTYYLTDRILSIDWFQSPSKETASIILSNHDQALSDINYNGYLVTLAWGIDIAGTPYTRTMPPAWVYEKNKSSSRGISQVELFCKGIVSRIDDDVASEEYDGSGSASSIVDNILTANLSPFDHCHSWEVEWHGHTGLDSIRIFGPSDFFSIGIGSNRLASAMRLLAVSDSVMQAQEDGKIHIRKVRSLTDDPDHEFTLADHPFFWKRYHDKLYLPNDVRVTCEAEDDVSYSGSAQDADSIAAYESVRLYKKAYDLESNSECDEMAEAILEGKILAEPKGEVEIPVHAYLRLGEYVKLIDVREGTTRYGNVGSINWHYSKGRFRQRFAFGGWATSKEGLAFHQDYPVQSFKREFDYWNHLNGYWLFSTAIPGGGTASDIIGLCTVPNYRRLYVKSYYGYHTTTKENANPRLIFAIYDWETESWTPIEGHTYSCPCAYSGPPIPVYDSYGETIIAFLIARDSDDGYNGKGWGGVQFNVAYLGGNFP